MKHLKSFEMISYKEAEKTIKNDDDNPYYAFSLLSNEMLSKFIKGEYDAIHIAKVELSSRGYDLEGNWVGMKGSEQYFKE